MPMLAPRKRPASIPSPSASAATLQNEDNSNITTTADDDGNITTKIEQDDWKPTTRLYIVVLTLCVMTLVVALDATSLSVALPTIAEKLRGTAIEAFWSGTSFLLCSTVFQPAFGSFSNIFGRKPLILIALLFFTVGSIVPAVANNFTVILIGRSIQGVGGGGIISLSEIVITDLVPLRLRGQYFGFMSSMWALGSVCGPLLGGGFAQSVSWRWIFYINLPLCAIAFVLVPIFLNLNQKMESIKEKLARVDWIGTVVFVGSTTSVLVPISWGGIMYPWDHWRILLPLVLGFAGLVGFLVWEIYGAREPLITLHVFTNRTAAVSYTGTVMHGIILWCIVYYLPLYYEAVKDLSPTMAGVAMFPQTFTVAPASVIVGIIVSITGRFRWAVWTGWVLTTTGMGLMYLLDVNTPTVEWVFLNLVAGVGTGMLFPSMSFAIQASASDKDTAIAVAMFSFLRAFGQSFGVAIGGVIFQNALVKEFAKYANLKDFVSAGGTKDAVALVHIIKTMPRVGASALLRKNLIQSYTDALKIVWLSMVAFGVVGLVTSLFTEGLSLNRALVSEQFIRDEKKSEDSGAV